MVPVGGSWFALGPWRLARLGEAEQPEEASTDDGIERGAQGDLDGTWQQRDVLAADRTVDCDCSSDWPCVRRVQVITLLFVSACLSWFVATRVQVQPSLQSMGDNVSLKSQLVNQAKWNLNGKEMGCTNWREIALRKYETKADVQDCGELCGETAGCMAFGFQPKACEGPDQASEGACFLWGELCHLEANVCWDNYRMDRPPVPLPWGLASRRTGCANRDKIGVQESVEWNANECGEKCRQSDGCTAFNFQPRTCKGPGSGEKGECHLFSGPCKQESNVCLDFYLMAPPPSATEAQIATFKLAEPASEGSRYRRCLR
ncbi:unnamed protein product [Prorocentrum cordatum]|uniref:Apple domain-containing protein n=1 Tax=Prorocentrum cordatum TaxID=2364126 RepID=A0ABN9SYL7_9DINO|nr:unnamed protein product [Polarella glacialis]